MIGLIINVVLGILLIGLILFTIKKVREYNWLEEDYQDLCHKVEETCKQLDITIRENEILQKENDRLNQVPKTERISKPRKTTAKKTDKK